MLMEQRYRKLSDAVPVHRTDVRVPLERLCGEKKIGLVIVHCGKRFLKYTVILLNTNFTRYHRAIDFRSSE